MQGSPRESVVNRATRNNDGKETTIAWIVGSSSSLKGDESRGAQRNTDAVTAPIRADGKKRSRGIRSPGGGVKACHHTGEKSFRCACFRFHQWGSLSDAHNGPSILSCPCGRMHRRGEDGPVRGPERYDHDGRRKPCPGQQA